MKKFIFILMAIVLFQQSALSSTTYKLYDCPSMMRYNPSVINPDKSCKYAERFGMTKEECYKAMKEEYSETYKEFSSGQCKPNGYHIETTYNTTDCSIQFSTSPSPRIMSHSYVNDKNMGYNGGSDLDGAKCIDILYRELQTKYPNLKK